MYKTTPYHIHVFTLLELYLLCLKVVRSQYAAEEVDVHDVHIQRLIVMRIVTLVHVVVDPAVVISV